MGVTGKKKRKGRVVHKHMNRPKVFLFLSPPRKQKKNRMAAFFFQSFCMLRLIDLKCRFKDEQMSNGPELGNPFRFGNFWGFSRAHTHKHFLVPKKKRTIRHPSTVRWRKNPTTAVALSKYFWFVFLVAQLVFFLFLSYSQNETRRIRE